MEAPCSFLTLPGTLPFGDELMQDDLLGHQLSELLSDGSDLDLTGILGSSDHTVGRGPATPQASCPLLQSARSLDASSPSLSPESLPHVAAHTSADSTHRQAQAPQAVPNPSLAPLPLGQHGLKLHLDCGSVMAAWHSVHSGRHPFQLHGPQLAAAAAAIPSAADLAASLSVATMLPGRQQNPGGSSCGGPCTGRARGDDVSSAGSAASAAAAAASASEAARQAAAAQRRAAERKVAAAFPVRRLASDKRPRIKGRFVSRAEYEQAKAARVMAAAAAADEAAAQALSRALPRATPAAC
ncbi:hypothetical protein ABPG75_008412 [Micractinium tetrahymenae]